MTVKISSLTKEFLRTKVRGDGDLSGLQVFFAFKPWAEPPTDPAGGDWTQGEWEPGDDNIARILVGPAPAKTLAKGRYHAWIKVISSPEEPIILFDTVRVE